MVKYRTFEQIDVSLINILLKFIINAAVRADLCRRVIGKQSKNNRNAKEEKSKRKRVRVKVREV